ncbi:hypothetical protein [Methanocella conradii]|uniref:hypothetical protein n=1 Tax=Methanocella conradii TaxID=1175444 RepID=UPI00157C981B|nr:hypothetical protein [Methanocella conradii]
MARSLIPPRVTTALMVLFTAFLFLKYGIPDEWDIGNMIVTAFYNAVRPTVSSQAGGAMDLMFLG